MDWIDVPNPSARARLRRAFIAASVCFAINVVAVAGTIAFLQPASGSMNLAERAQSVLAHPMGWRVGWAAWMLSGLSLVLLYAALGATLAADVKPARYAALLTAALAAVADLAGLWIFAASLPAGYARLPLHDLFLSPQAWQDVRIAEEIAALLSGGLASGLYTVAGLILAWAAWSTPGFPRALIAAAAPSVLCGTALTVTAIRRHPPAVPLTALLACLIPWLGALSLVLRRRTTAAVDRPGGPG